MMTPEPTSSWTTLVARRLGASAWVAKLFGPRGTRRAQPADPADVFRPVAGSNARMRVMDGEYSPLELLAMERRRCVDLQRENERLRRLSDRLGLRVQILEQS